MSKKVLFITLVLLVSILTTIASLLGCGDLGATFIFVVVLDSIAIILLGFSNQLRKHSKTQGL